MLSWLKAFLFSAQPPPWQAPRPIDQQFEGALFETLQSRLDELIVFSRARHALLRDRETQQGWVSTCYDFEFWQYYGLEPVDPDCFTALLQLPAEATSDRIDSLLRGYKGASKALDCPP